MRGLGALEHQRSLVDIGRYRLNPGKARANRANNVTMRSGTDKANARPDKAQNQIQLGRVLLRG